MHQFFRMIITASMIAILMIGVSGCTKEGPVEKAGKQIDKTIEKAGEEVEKAKENVQDAVK